MKSKFLLFAACGLAFLSPAQAARASDPRMVACDTSRVGVLADNNVRFEIKLARDYLVPEHTLKIELTPGCSLYLKDKWPQRFVLKARTFKALVRAFEEAAPPKFICRPGDSFQFYDSDWCQSAQGQSYRSIQSSYYVTFRAEDPVIERIDCVRDLSPEEFDLEVDQAGVWKERLEQGFPGKRGVLKTSIGRVPACTKPIEAKLLDARDALDDALAALGTAAARAGEASDATEQERLVEEGDSGSMPISSGEAAL